MHDTLPPGSGLVTGIMNRRAGPQGPRFPAIRVVAGDDNLSPCVVYPGDEVEIGRDEGCDLVLTHPSVSRRHARVTEQDGHLVLEDLGSTNGTGAAAGPVTAPTPVAVRDLFSVGDVTLRIDTMTVEEIRHLERATERLRRSAQDPLTGALARAWLEENLDTLEARTRLRGERLSVLFADVDRFKEINDRHGHAVGDRVLAEVGRILVFGVRETDRVVRYGGEEFLVLLGGCTEPHARALAERLRAAVEGRGWAEWVPQGVTASFGAAELGSGERLADCVRRADAAMYRAKQEGRNRVRGSATG